MTSQVIHAGTLTESFYNAISPWHQDSQHQAISPETTAQQTREQKNKQDNSTTNTRTEKQTGLYINQRKTKTMRVNSRQKVTSKLRQ